MVRIIKRTFHRHGYCDWSIFLVANDTEKEEENAWAAARPSVVNRSGEAKTNHPSGVYMYLSDVEEGGETVFTRLNISVAPRKGSAILWPSVHSSDVHATDERTSHEARPVLSGTKYAANFWIHLFDFQTFHGHGCDNLWQLGQSGAHTPF